MAHWSYPHRHHHPSRHWVTGLILIGVGSVFLLDRLGYIDGIAATHFWPFILAILGVARMLEGRSVKHVAKGGFLVFLAFWLFASIEHLWGLTFQTSWPMVLIALGLTHMVRGLSSPAEKHDEGKQP